MAPASSRPTLVQSLFANHSAPVSLEEGEKGKTDSQDIPDGGTIAWLQVVSAFFFSFNAWGMFYLVYAVQSYYQTTLLKSHTSWGISWIGNIQGLLILFTAALTGPLYDWGYSGHSHFFLGVGSFFLVFGTMMISLTKQLAPLILAQGLTVGFGAGCVFIPSIANVITYFEKKRGLAVGIALSGGPIGGIIYTAIFRQVLKRIIYADVIRIIGFIAMLTLLIALMLWKPREMPRPERRLVATEALKEPLFLLYTVAMLIGFIGVFIPLFEIQSFARAHTKISIKKGFYIISVFNAGTAFGSIVSGFLADKIGPLNVMVVSTFWAGMMCFIWISVISTWRVIAFAGVFGFFAASFIGSVAPVAIASLSKDISRIGGRLGLVYGLAGCGLLVSNPITQGFLRHGTFLRLQVFAGFFLIGPTFIFLLARVGKVGWNHKIKA